MINWFDLEQAMMSNDPKVLLMEYCIMFLFVLYSAAEVPLEPGMRDIDNTVDDCPQATTTVSPAMLLSSSSSPFQGLSFYLSP